MHENNPFINVLLSNNYIFYKNFHGLSPGISHPTGNKSDIKRERLGPNIYASHMAQVIEKTQTDAYIDFVAKYPDIKIGQRTFDKLKPFFVPPASEKDRNRCCCRYHIESNLLFKSCMKFRKSKNQSETSVVESYPVYENLGEIIDVTVCPKVSVHIKNIASIGSVWSVELGN